MNQEPGYRQSLKNWTIVQEGDAFFIECMADRNKRFRAPDGSHMVEGVPHPSFIEQRTWEMLRDQMTHQASDVWVTTFPKCGTTLMEQVILLLRHGGDPAKLDPRDKNTFSAERGMGKVWPEANVSRSGHEQFPKRMRLTFDQFEALPGPRLMKTHAPRHLFLGTLPFKEHSLARCPRHAPLAPGVKVVYVSRNAKDACVSAYYHAGNPHRIGWPFDAWVKAWMSGLFEHGRWADHVAGWRAEALMNPGQVLWVRYEDFIEDPEREVRRVAAFIDLGDVSDEVIKATVKHSGFAAMKEQAQGVNHMRKGEVGDAKRHFSPELDKEFDDLYADLMRGVADPYSGWAPAS